MGHTKELTLFARSKKKRNAMGVGFILLLQIKSPDFSRNSCEQRVNHNFFSYYRSNLMIMIAVAV